MISGVVFATLRGLVNDKCYPNEFPQELIEPPTTIPALLSYPTWPALRYQILDSSNVATICGTDTEDTDDTSVQVDVVARTYGAAKALASQVIVAMQSTSPPCTRDGYFEVGDEETKTHRVILRFTFYASSVPGSP